MSTVDSNKEKKVELKSTGPAPAPVAAPPQKVKSYTERFIDMENTIIKMAYAINFQAKTIESLMKQADAMNQELDRLTMVRKSVNAMMKLSEEGKTNLSLDNVAAKVEELELQAAKDQLAQDLKDGVVKNADAIENDLNVFEFKSIPEGSYGIASLATINPELKAELVGKKVGDVVRNLEITGVYLYTLENPAANPQEGTDGKASDKATTEG